VDAARALSRFGPQAREYTPQLTALLDFDDAELVYAGARALASISHESRAMLDKVAYVVDENSKLEGKATRVAVALSRLYQEMPRFEDSLMNGTLVEQMEAARVMSTVDAVAAGIPWRDRLAEAAKSPRAHRAAIVGLGRLALSDNNWAGIEALDKKISSPDVEIRLAAVEMLGDLLEAENFNPRAGVRVSLKQFLTDPSPDVRAAAARKLAPPKP
jgi:hypothetical protein